MADVVEVKPLLIGSSVDIIETIKGDRQHVS